MKTVNYYPDGNVLDRLWRTLYIIGVVVIRFVMGKKRPKPIRVNSAYVSTISGIDCIVHICKPDKSTTPENIFHRVRNEDRKGITSLGTIQGISYEDATHKQKAPKVSGSILSTIFDRSIKNQIDKPFDLYIIATNEYGICTGMKIHKVKVIACAAGTSVDDVVMEEQFTYIADSMIHWQPIQESI